MSRHRKALSTQACHEFDPWAPLEGGEENQVHRVVPTLGTHADHASYAQAYPPAHPSIKSVASLMLKPEC